MSLRILANENFPFDAVDRLRAEGHDVLWIRTESPGVSDEVVLDLGEKRLLVTFDKDFGELVFAKGRTASCGVVLFRITMPSSAIAADRIAAGLKLRSDWEGHFSVVDDSRVRMIALPAAVPPPP